MDTQSDDRVPDITLERYRLNELPPEAAARLDRQLQRDPGLRQRLDALLASAPAPASTAVAMRMRFSWSTVSGCRRRSRIRFRQTLVATR